ncbi:MAG: hypothetical protein WKG07_46040 [Hymenobacter sp.]
MPPAAVAAVLTDLAVRSERRRPGRRCCWLSPSRPPRWWSSGRLAGPPGRRPCSPPPCPVRSLVLAGADEPLAAAARHPRRRRAARPRRLAVGGGGSVLDLPFPTAVTRALHAMAHGLAAPAFVAAPVRHRRSAAVLRGLASAIPLLVGLGLLLGSADPVFAGFFEWWSPRGGHRPRCALDRWGVGHGRPSAGRIVRPCSSGAVLPFRVGPVEATVVVGSSRLFGVFAAAQLVALSSGGCHVIRTAGLTYAGTPDPASSSCSPSPPSRWSRCRPAGRRRPVRLRRIAAGSPP